MENPDPKKEKVTVQTEIDRLLEKLNTLDPKEEEYHKVLKNVDMLTDIKTKKGPMDVSVDTVISASASILGILMILHHEKANIITSKAIGFIFKGR